MSALPIVLMLLAMGCGGSDSTIGGFLVALSGGTPPKDVSITAEGNNPVEVQVEFDEQATGNSLPFRIAGLVDGETYYFRLTHSSLDPLISFPYQVGGAYPLQLPAIASGTISNIGQQAVANNLISSVNSSLGIVMGQINPTGQVGCRSIRTVSLMSATGATTGNPTIYFNDSGTVLNTTGIADLKCSYIIFNVSPGSYQTQYLSDTFASVAQHDVLVLGGQTSFGLAIP